MKYFEIKSIPTQIKDLDLEKRIVKGVFAHMGSLDAHGDIIRHGAFIKTIAENGPNSAKPRIKHFYNHMYGVGKMLELEEQGDELVFVSSVGRHRRGQDVLYMYEDEIITEHSIGFKTLKSHSENNANILTELQLWEGSSLDGWGANMNTPVKSLEELHKRRAELQEYLTDTTEALRKGKYTDETFIELEIRLKMIQHYLQETTQPEADSTEPGLDMEKLLTLFNQKEK